jgi:hypothetical protein
MPDDGRAAHDARMPGAGSFYRVNPKRTDSVDGEGFKV